MCLKAAGVIFALQRCCDAFQLTGCLKELERTDLLWEESFSHQTLIQSVLPYHAFRSMTTKYNYEHSST